MRGSRSRIYGDEEHEILRKGLTKRDGWSKIAHVAAREKKRKSAAAGKRRCVAQLGRALRSGRRGRWFESSRIDLREESMPLSFCVKIRELF